MQQVKLSTIHLFTNLAILLGLALLVYETRLSDGATPAGRGD